MVRGANAPEIIRTIQEQLAQENKVLKGEAQRKPVFYLTEDNRQTLEEELNKTTLSHFIRSSTL